MRGGGHRRRRRAGARRRGGADAALPDQNAHAVGRLDLRRTPRWCPPGSIGCVDSAGPSAVEPLRRPAAGRGRRTAGCPCGAPSRARSRPRRRARPGAGRVGLPHRGAEREAGALPRQRDSSVFTPASVSTVTVAPARRSCARATSAARQRSPLPESSDGAAVGVPAAASWRAASPIVKRISPSAPMPRWRWHTARVKRRRIGRRAVVGRQQEVVAVGVGLDEAHWSPSGNLKGVEHVGEPGGEPDAGIARRQAERTPRRRRASRRWCSGRRDGTACAIGAGRRARRRACRSAR